MFRALTTLIGQAAQIWIDRKGVGVATYRQPRFNRRLPSVKPEENRPKTLTSSEQRGLLAAIAV